MKNRIITILLCLLITSANAQTFNGPGEYMTLITKEFKYIMKDMWDYSSAVAHGKSARKVETKRKQLIQQIDAGVSKIMKMPPYEKDRSLKDSAVSYLKLCKTILNRDYAKIVDMEAIAEQSYDAMEAYLLAQEMAEDRMDEAGKMIDAQEKKFAADHDVTLIEGEADKTSKNLAEAGKVFDYYNPVYLIFFKSYKQEAYMLEAQNKGDVNAMEQNRNALISTVAESKKKLAAVESYKGDNSLKQACQEVLNFYEDEAKRYEQMSNYFLEKEKFDKIKTAFDAKPQNKRSKEDIDQYNNAVNTFNAALNKYNALNEELYNKRSAALKKWNDASSNFTSKHTPKR